MGFTYTWQNALDVVAKFIKDIPVTDVDSQICDLVNSAIYTRLPWPWTLADLSAITLVDDQQDYTNGQSNFYRLARVRIVQTDLSPAPSRALDIKTHQEPETGKGGYTTLRAISREDSTSDVFRLNLRAGLESPTVLQIQGEYQVNPTKVTDATLGAALWAPDQYFPVFVEGLKWKLYQLTDDRRAGSVIIDRSGNVQYTGQLAVFHDWLENMARAEDYGDGEITMFPEDALGFQGTGYSPGMFW